MKVQQLYCTHCTYGTSALEQRRGELAGETLGYSVRAGSLAGEELRRLYRHVERHMSYHLPGDTPPERKLRLDAATAPRRLVFIPSVDGSALLAQVCYRTTDTAGRPGSYFAHALVGQPDGTGSRWTALEAIRAWNSPQWVTTDHDRIPARLDGSDSLAAWLRNGQVSPAAHAAPDDAAVIEFLRGGSNGAMNGLLPERLADVPAERRRQLLAAALERFWEVLGGRANSLVLLAEPALAAVIFYALLRLVPPEACGRDVGFSTFEPTPERAATPLAATCHDDPRRDLPPECYRAAGYHVASTAPPFRTTPLRSEPARYPALVLERLFESGWPGVDALHAGFRAVGAAGPAQWERLAQAHGDAARLLDGGGESVRIADDAPPFVRDYMRRVVVAHLARTEDHFSSPDTATHAALLRLIGRAEDAQAEAALAVLLDRLPDAEAPRFLRDETQSLERRRTVALRHLRAHGRWPEGVPLRPLLPLLVGALSAEELKSLSAHLPPQRGEFLAILHERRADNPAADRLLTAAVDAPDDDALCQRLGDAPLPALLGADSPAGERLRQRLAQVIAGLRSDPEQGVSRLTALERVADRLGEPERQAVRKWTDLRDALAAAAAALRAETGPVRWFGISSGASSGSNGSNGSASGHGEGGPWAALYTGLAQMPVPVEAAREIDAAENRLEKRLRVVAAARRCALPLLAEIGNPHVLWPRMEARVQAEVVAAASDGTFLEFLASPSGRGLMNQAEPVAAAAHERLEHTAATLTADPAHFRRRLDLLGSREARNLLGPQAAPLEQWGQIADQLDSLRAVVSEHPALSHGECPEPQTPRVAKIGRHLGRLFADVPYAARQLIGTPTGERGRQAWYEHARDFIARSVNVPMEQPPQLWEAFTRSHLGSDNHPVAGPPNRTAARPAERSRMENWLPQGWRPKAGEDINLLTPKILGTAVAAALVLAVLAAVLWNANRETPPPITKSDNAGGSPITKTADVVAPLRAPVTTSDDPPILAQPVIAEKAADPPVAVPGDANSIQDGQMERFAPLPSMPFDE